MTKIEEHNTEMTDEVNQNEVVLIDAKQESNF